MPAPTRTRRTPPATTGRFSRPGAAARSTTAQRRAIAGGLRQRRQSPKQSGLKRALGGVTGALPGLATKRSSSSSKAGKTGKAGGLALLAGVAGLAFKNRDKVASMAKRDNAGSDVETAPAAPVYTSPDGTGTTSLNTSTDSKGTGTGTSLADDSAAGPQPS